MTHVNCLQYERTLILASGFVVGAALLPAAANRGALVRVRVDTGGTLRECLIVPADLKADAISEGDYIKVEGVLRDGRFLVASDVTHVPLPGREGRAVVALRSGVSGVAARQQPGTPTAAPAAEGPTSTSTATADASQRTARTNAPGLSVAARQQSAPDRATQASFDHAEFDERIPF